MSGPGRNEEAAIRERAYFIWDREGRPEGRAMDHWVKAESAAGVSRPDSDAALDDEELVIEGRSDANMPALLTKDVPGG